MRKFRIKQYASRIACARGERYARADGVRILRNGLRRAVDAFKFTD